VSNDWNNWAEFDLNLLKQGDVVKSLNHACTMAGQDIQDRNKPYNKKRTVVLKLVFETDEDRHEVDISATVEKKFPADNPQIDRVQLEPSTGRPFHNLMGQQELPMVDTETGEVVSSLIRKESYHD
jgi:hypothetical protein